MKKTLTINLAGYVFHIDEDAYYMLDNYVQNLRAYFHKENDADEIVKDMEQRISELFADILKQNNREVVTIEDVESVIKILGSPEQMEANDSTEAYSGYKVVNDNKKRLFRNMDDKILGGVCSGFAAYFGWDVTVVRIAMIILGIFVHGVILAYIIGWIIIPPAKTVYDKLYMQGKAVNIENIGKTVTDGYEKVKTKMNSEETKSTAYAIGDGFVKCVGVLIKIILILLAICFTPVILALLIVFFVLVFVATGLIAATPAMIANLNMLMPAFNWTSVSTCPIETLIVSIAGIFIIGIPIIGIIHLLMRYFGGWQPMSIATKIGFIIFWFIALGVGVFYAFHIPIIGSNLLSVL